MSTYAPRGKNRQQATHEPMPMLGQRAGDGKTRRTSHLQLEAWKAARFGWFPVWCVGGRTEIQLLSQCPAAGLSHSIFSPGEALAPPSCLIRRTLLKTDVFTDESSCRGGFRNLCPHLLI